MNIAKLPPCWLISEFYLDRQSTAVCPLQSTLLRRRRRTQKLTEKHLPTDTGFPGKMRKVFIDIIIQWLTWPDARGQYLWIRSSKVKGMVKRLRKMLDSARLAIRMFLGVFSIWNRK